MRRNSTIRQKTGSCNHPGCSYKGALTKGKCPTHYWSGIRMKSVAKLEQQEISESLQTVIDDLDIIFSQYIRLRDSDENGYVTCYCGCGMVVYWTESQCMHFIPREHMSTRFSEDNCHGGCRNCNEVKKGNLIEYGKRLEEDRPGMIETLEDQARTLYKYDIPELKSFISHYSKEVNRIRKLKPMKL